MKVMTTPKIVSLRFPIGCGSFLSGGSRSTSRNKASKLDDMLWVTQRAAPGSFEELRVGSVKELVAEPIIAPTRSLGKCAETHDMSPHGS
jgi:hypothetical protein